MQTHDSRAQRMMAIGHYLTAAVLLLKATAYLGHAPVPWPFVLLCLASGLLVIVLTLFHHRVTARFPRAPGCIYLAEGLVCAVLAHHTHAEGKTGLPWAWGVAAVLLLARGAWEFFRRPAVASDH